MDPAASLASSGREICSKFSFGFFEGDPLSTGVVAGATTPKMGKPKLWEGEDSHIAIRIISIFFRHRAKFTASVQMKTKIFQKIRSLRCSLTWVCELGNNHKWTARQYQNQIRRWNGRDILMNKHQQHTPLEQIDRKAKENRWEWTFLHSNGISTGAPPDQLTGNLSWKKPLRGRGQGDPLIVSANRRLRSRRRRRRRRQWGHVRPAARWTKGRHSWTTSRSAQLSCGTP